MKISGYFENNIFCVLKDKKSQFNAFTLAEMMVVLLIISIILAAMAPVITTRMRSDSSQNSSPWKWVSGNGIDAYFGVKEGQSAMIGQSKKETDDSGKLIIKTSSGSIPQVSFKLGNNSVGKLMLNASSIILGSASVSSTSNNNTLIGASTNINSGNNGNYNTSLGYDALSENTSGSFNTAIGGDALSHNTTGTYNVALGFLALIENTSGSFNTAIGGDALSYNFTGDYNTALGYEALSNNESGSYNIAIGYQACKDVTGSNKVCIGKDAGPTSSSSDASNNDERIYIGGTSSSVTYFAGDVKVTGDIYNNGNNLVTSDKRLKNVGEEYKSGLDKIRQLKTFNYTYKKDQNKTPHVGVIAQDLQKVFPNAVVKDSEGYFAIRQEDMFYALINAVKELDAKITELIENQKQILKEINALRKENQELKKRLDKLESR